MEPSGAYIHFPFCLRLCFYCHFCKYPVSDSFRDKYAALLIREILLHKSLGKSIDTVYIGGGSPSLLTEKELEMIIRALEDTFLWNDQVEFSIECNPEDINPQLLKTYRDLGVNRLSLGVQSFEDSDLLYLKRRHSGLESIAALELIYESGFTNVNVDLIIGLPGQSGETIRKSLGVINRFNIPHLSVYLLEGVDKGQPDERNEVELYYFVRDYLLESDFNHYEVSNYVRDGSECRHNLKYWRGEQYIGLGVSASGYEDGMDYSNHNILKAYASSVKGKLFPRNRQEHLNPDLRRLVMGLRLAAGVEYSCFDNFESQRDLLLEGGFLQERGSCLAVHPDKILMLNEILGYFI